MTPHKLGTWRTRSGNTVDVSVTDELQPGYREFDAEWSQFPPSEGDLIEWALRILPLATERTTEYLELVGPGLIVTQV